VKIGPVSVSVGLNGTRTAQDKEFRAGWHAAVVAMVETVSKDIRERQARAHVSFDPDGTKRGGEDVDMMTNLEAVRSGVQGLFTRCPR
jgi:hypothetical protein